MKNMFIRLNTILIPENKSRRRILRLANQMFGRDNIFHIDDKQYFAHLTIYSPEYPVGNLPMIIKTVNRVGSVFDKIRLEVIGIYVANRSVCLAFKKSAEVNDIHKLVLKRLNPLRENRIRDKYEDEIKNGKYSKKEAEYIEKFGYPNVLDRYHPHLTLGRYNSDSGALEAKKKIDESKVPSDILFPYIAVSEMGPNGTCTKILERIELR